MILEEPHDLGNIFIYMYSKAFTIAICRLRIESYDSAIDDLNFVIKFVLITWTRHTSLEVAKMRLNDFLEHWLILMKLSTIMMSTCVLI